MRHFYFGLIKPKNPKIDIWFFSATIVLLAGFFSLGISTNSVQKRDSDKKFEIKFIKNQQVFAIKKRDKIEFKLVDKAKELEIKNKEEEKKKEIEKQVVQNIPKQIIKPEPTTTPVVQQNNGLSHNSLEELYQKAGASFGLDWRILAAIHLVETGQAIQHYRISYAGARGPMQFLPSTFYSFAIDGDGDGIKDIYDIDDAVFTAANYLASNGGMANINQALFRYNHSYSYVNRVLALANQF